MDQQKDSPEVVKFMKLFAKVKDIGDDDPEALVDLARRDEGVKDLCIQLFSAANLLARNERRRRELFAGPVDPKFQTSWRDYEKRFSSVLADIWLADIFLESRAVETEPGSEIDLQWLGADGDADEQARAINQAIEFAYDQATDDGREFPSGFRENIAEGEAAWDRLVRDAGFDLRGVFRRRELVPFVLVPRHVAAKQASPDKLTMLRSLREAHEAFVFGTPLAALALMRSVIEVVLRDYYGAKGADLSERINNARDLPTGANTAALHRLRKLANAALHPDSDESEKLRKIEPERLEKEIVSLLMVLRTLIENAPQRLPR